MKSFSNDTLKFSLRQVLSLLQFGSCQNWMTTANLVAETQLKLLNERNFRSKASWKPQEGQLIWK